MTLSGIQLPNKDAWKARGSWLVLWCMANLPFSTSRTRSSSLSENSRGRRRDWGIASYWLGARLIRLISVNVSWTAFLIDVASDVFNLVGIVLIVIISLHLVPNKIEDKEEKLKYSRGNSEVCDRLPTKLGNIFKWLVSKCSSRLGVRNWIGRQLFTSWWIHYCD